MNTQSKITKLEDLKRKVAQQRRKGKKIAFTNGCFDLLHLGHVSYLQEAKKANRILIVGLNSDQSIRKIKGPKRPIVGEKERAPVLAALACVDFVIIFREETPEKLIKNLRPDILIKGADWKGKNVVGGEFIQSYGGKVEYIKYIPQCSTTNMIEKIRANY